MANRGMLVIVLEAVLVIGDSPTGRIANPGKGENEESKGSLGGNNVGGGNNFVEETQSIDGDVTDEEVPGEGENEESKGSLLFQQLCNSSM